MLKGIPAIIPPELLKILAEMGHGDEIVIGDGNFPGAAMNKTCVRCDGHNATDLLKAVLKIFPLDTYQKPVYIMEKVKGDTVETPIWDKYKEIIAKHDERGAKTIKNISRFDFYDAAKSSYAVVATGESALYACIILKKGVIKE